MDSTSEVLKFNKNYKVTVHRNLVEATFSQPLTIREQKILYTALSNLPAPEFLKDDKGNFVLDELERKQITNYVDELPSFSMYLKDFAELIGIKEIEYGEIRKICTNFMQKLVEVRKVDSIAEGERSFRYIQWVIDCEYIDNTGWITIKLSPSLLPYVANLTENFVSVSLGTITNFKSKYSARLYFLLQQWRKVKNKEVTLERLKEVLGVPVIRTEKKDGKQVKIFKLDRYTHFKQRALEPAINEINQFSDMIIEFKEVKKGRKTNSIQFTISDKPQQPKQEKPLTKAASGLIESSVYVHLIRNAGFGDFNIEFYKNAANALEKIPGAEFKQKRISYHLNQLNIYTKKHTDGIKSPTGFIISQIKKAVERYNETGDFNFYELFDKAGMRVERMPDWTFEEENPTEAPERNSDFEKEKAKSQESLQQEDFERQKAELQAELEARKQKKE